MSPGSPGTCAAGVGVLAGEDEVGGPEGGLAVALVAGHQRGLGQGHGGDALVVEVGVVGTPAAELGRAAEVAVVALAVEEELEPVGYNLLVGPILGRRVVGREERQHRQARACHVVRRPGPSARLAVVHHHGPASVRLLLAGEVGQAAIDGPLRLLVAAHLLDQRLAPLRGALESARAWRPSGA